MGVSLNVALPQAADDRLVVQVHDAPLLKAAAKKAEEAAQQKVAEEAAQQKVLAKALVP